MLKFIALRRLFYVHLNIVVGGIFLNIASVLGPNKKSAVLPGAVIYDSRLVWYSFEQNKNGISVDEIQTVYKFLKHPNLETLK